MIKNGAGIHDFQKIIDDNPSVLHLSLGRYKDATNYNNEGFNKDVRDNYDRSLTFCVSKNNYDRHFHIYVQTPFCRSPIYTKTLSSATAAEKEIANIVRNQPEDIRATAAIFDKMRKYSKQVKDMYMNNELSLDERADKARDLKLEILAELNLAKKHHKLLGDTDNLFVREVNDVASSNYRLTKERLEREMSDFPSLNDVLKDAESKLEDNSPDTKALSSPER